MSNPFRELEALGQSIWLDNIDRADLLSGQFKRLVAEDGLTGATGNPTIFEHAITRGTAYDEQMQPLLREGKSPQEIYEALAISDEQHVADLLRPIYEQTDGQDGFVSIEVSPALAHDTAGTIVEVRRFWQAIARPNLMVKIPSTPAGIPAIRQALSEGININITLIFSLENYRQVGEAYLSALEDRLAADRDISHIASVASFFVSRVDVLIDRLLENKIAASRTPAEQQQLKALQGRAAIANARLAYQEFKRLFGTARFEALRQHGARVQRPLWASTGVKNPAYRDVRYVEELIGPNTVNTMPLATLERFRDHGRVRLSVEEDLLPSQEVLTALEATGIDYDQITRHLQEEGVQTFVESFDQLMQCLEDKRKAIGSKNMPYR